MNIHTTDAFLTWLGVNKNNIKTVHRAGRGKHTEYYNIPCAFDIETSSFYDNNEKSACMYIWQFGFDGLVVMGRTWAEFVALINGITEILETGEDRRLLVYVHNLAYEFQFMRGYFSWAQVFSLAPRKVCYATTETGIEFRCSYILTGKSLAGVAEDCLKYPCEKMTGDLDYDLVRHSGTPLTEKELDYCYQDVAVIMNYIREQIEIEDGSICNIPLTKTGYVRRFCRNMCMRNTEDDTQKYTRYRALMKKLTITPEEYLQLKRAFAGGYTHANAVYVGEVVENVASYDFTSSYPAVMLSEQFPMSAAHEYTPKNYEDFLEHLKKYCCMFDCRLTGVKQRPGVPDSYLMRSKCINLKGARVNNGRVYSCDVCLITMTDVDWKIFSYCYTFENIELGSFRYYYRGYLPKDLILAIIELYKSKTTLKGVEGSEAEYQLKKGMLNAAYGMCVTDPCKDDVLYEGMDWGVDQADVAALITKYNNSLKRFLFYPWGVWVTAYARKNLWTGILECGEDYVYSDTDSVKLKNPETHTEYFKRYDRAMGSKLYKMCRYYGIEFSDLSPETIKGEKKPIGVWDYEGVYTRFKTLGAKRYMTEKAGSISLTVSGVNKKSTVPYLMEKHGSEGIFEAFNEELSIPAGYCGKLTHTYIDCPRSGVIIDYRGVSGGYSELTCTHMEPAGYDFSLAQEFLYFIHDIKEEKY